MDKFDIINTLVKMTLLISYCWINNNTRVVYRTFELCNDSLIN